MRTIEFEFDLYGLLLVQKIPKPFCVGTVSLMCVKHLFLAEGELSVWLLLDRGKKWTNLLLTEREGRTGECWPEVVAVRTQRSEVRTKTTEGQYSPVRLEQARFVSNLLYGIVFLGEETLSVISSSLFWIIKLTWQMFIFFIVFHVVNQSF